MAGTIWLEKRGCVPSKEMVKANYLWPARIMALKQTLMLFVLCIFSNFTTIFFEAKCPIYFSTLSG